MSGLSRTPGKRVWVYPHRGFESRLLRQYKTFIFYIQPLQKGASLRPLTFCTTQVQKEALMPTYNLRPMGS